ncbi:MAG: hypothetical protein ABL940_13255, partial [Bacteroidia bacterium]
GTGSYHFFIKVLASTTAGTTGGRLVLENCTIKGMPNSFWSGIYVCGNTSLSQSNTRMARAYINNSTLTDMSTGVCNYDWNLDNSATYTTGGIIIANNSTFKESNNCILMKKYQNWLTTVTNKRNDLSTFKKCTFTISYNSYFMGLPAVDLVYLNEVEGVTFSGCTFGYLTNGANNWNVKGINLLSAGVNVGPVCNNTNVPCNSYTYSTFNNLSYGIYAMNNNSFHRVSSYQSVFDLYKTTFSTQSSLNNQYGIFLNGCNNASINRNTFNITAENLYLKYGGIHLEGCKQYSVMENTINTTTGILSILNNYNNKAYGITVNNSGQLANEIYKNTISGNQFNLYADGDNRSLTAPASVGLAFKCNTLANSPVYANLSNWSDITIQLNGSGIPTTQGQTVTGAATLSYANMFSGTLGYSIDNNPNPITYYGSIPNGVRGAYPATIVAANNMACPSLICEAPCNTAQLTAPVATYTANKQSMTTTLQTQYGTPAFDNSLQEYQTLIKQVSDVYMGEPQNPNAVIRYDSLAMVLGEASLSGYYGARTTANAKRNYIIDYPIMKAGLLVQQHQFDDAVALLTTAATTFKLTNNEQEQLQEVIRLIIVEKALDNGTQLEEIDATD